MLHQVVKLLLQQPDLERGLPSSVLVADDCFSQSSISTVRTADLIARAVSETLGRRQSRTPCESGSAHCVQCANSEELFDGGGAAPQTRHISLHNF